MYAAHTCSMGGLSVIVGFGDQISLAMSGESKDDHPCSRPQMTICPQ